LHEELLFLAIASGPGPEDQLEAFLGGEVAEVVVEGGDVSW
jgi:hypothetical protein